MGTRIDGSNQTSPILDNSLPEGNDLGPEKQHLADNFEDVASKAADILNQNVRKGDMESARARVADLKGHFESLSSDLKKEMYRELTQKGAKGGLKETFDYKLSTPSRESLLKILNPDHVSPRQLSQAQMDKVKASKTGEKNLEGKLQEAWLRKAFDTQIGENGPGAVKMPQPKSGDPVTPFTPGPVKMPTVPNNDNGPGAIKMPQPKSGEPTTTFTPGPVKMPTFPSKDSGPGAIKMPEPKAKEPGIPFNPGPVKMPQPEAGNEINSQPGIDADAFRKFLKGDKR